SGVADVLQTMRDWTEEELALCAESAIEVPRTLDLGYEAVVLAAPARNDWLTCPNAETFEAIFGRGAEDSAPAETWSPINGDWPESEPLLVVPPVSTGETDFDDVRLLGRLDLLV